jgi:hypothetical protein
MKSYFRFIAGNTGRWLRGILGFALLAWGYSSYSDEGSIILMVVGAIIMLAAIFDWTLLAPLFGYPFIGKKIREKYGSMDQPGDA